MSLLDKAREEQEKLGPGGRNVKGHNEEEFELCIAYLVGEIKGPAVSIVTGRRRNSGALSQWVGTVLTRAFQAGKLVIKA